MHREWDAGNVAKGRCSMIMYVALVFVTLFAGPFLQESRPLVPTKPESASTDNVAPSSQQGKALAQALHAVRLKEAELETARAQFRAIVFETMARLKLSPDEYSVVENEESGVVFVKASPKQLAPTEKSGKPHNDR